MEPSSTGRTFLQRAVDRLAWTIDPKTYVNPFTWIIDII